MQMYVLRPFLDRFGDTFTERTSNKRNAFIYEQNHGQTFPFGSIELMCRAVD